MFSTIITFLAILTLTVVILLMIHPIRRALVSRPLFSTYRKVLPQMSDTERDALEAGTVWWDGELFCGKPDWQQAARLSAAEADARKNSPSSTTRWRRPAAPWSTTGR